MVSPLRFVRAVAVITLLLFASTAHSHPSGFLPVELQLDSDRFRMVVHHHLEAAVGDIETLPAESAGRIARFYQVNLKPSFNGKRAMPDPTGEVAVETTSYGQGARIALEGQLPAAPDQLSFEVARAIPVIHLRVLGDGGRQIYETFIRKGETSPPIDLRAPAVPGSPAHAASDGGWSTVALYLSLGFTHILPLGWDHVLFVLGLFLLTPRLKPLVLQLSLFTLAHSLTLALASLGWVALPAAVVEPLIAVSIAFIAVENIFRRNLGPWRPLIVFAFGLLHGLGFAGVLSELGLPAGQFLTALVSFNVGVEIGQLAVVTLAFAAVGWFRHREWYRGRVTVPASAVIAMIGFYWAVERVLGQLI